MPSNSSWYKQRIFIVSFGLFAFSWLLYGNTLRNGYNIDDGLVTQNHPLTNQGISAIPRIFQSPYYFDEAGYAFDYRPIVSSSFALEHSLFGENAAISHGINVFLYGLSGVLLFFLLRLILPKDDPRKVWFPGLVSLLFLIHPLHTEVVNSIKNRDELLALLFGLAATYLFLYGKDRKSTWAWYALGTGIFTMGLMSKLSVLSFAILIPVSLVLFRKVNWKEVMAISLPLTTVSLFLLPPLSTIIILQVSLAFLLLPLTVLLTQKVPVLQSNRVLQNQNLSYAIPQLICLALLLMSIVGWLANPYDPLLLLILWVMMGLSLLTFANSPIIGWIIVGIYVLTALVTMPYFNHKLLTVGSLYGLFFLFTPKKHSPDKKWWPHALWVLLAGGYLAATGSPATLGLLAITAGLLWLGTTRRVAKGNIIAMIASLGLTIYLGIEQSFLAMATGLSIGVFIATLQLKSLKKHRYTISFGLVTVIGIFALLQEQISSPTLPTSQVETVTIQIPEPVEDRNRRTLEFSENPLPFQATEKRLPTALNITQQYLQLLVWPAPLRFYYGYNMLPILDWSSPKVWGALFLLLGLSVLTLSAIFWDTWVAWGGILLLLSLAQFSNYLIPLPGIIGERFLYIGSLGFIVLMVQLSNLAIQKWQLVQKQRFRTIGVLLSVGLIVGVSLYVIKRNQHWKDRLTLYQHDITHLSQSAKAQQLLAAELLKKAEEVAEEAHRTMLLKEASKHFKACVAIYPNFPYGFFDLGTTQMKLGNYAEAQQSTERSLDVDVYNPQARFQLAMIHELQSEWLQAVDDYQMTITNHPDMLEAYLNLSTLLFRTGDVQDGLQIAYTALERWPNSLALLTNIGNVLASQRRYTEAAIYFTRALQQSAGERSLIEKIIFCYQQINRPDLAEPYLRMLQ